VTDKDFGLATWFSGAAERKAIDTFSPVDRSARLSFMKPANGAR
jgi:hypothetical protein